MANKRLSNEQIAEMQEMVVNGVSPEDISNHFQIAISSVHNYKKRFRDQGLNFPMVRGKRPSGSVELIKPKLTQELDQVESKAHEILTKQQLYESLVLPGSPIGDNENSSQHVFKVVVKNKVIQIIGDIENIIIKKNSIEIQV